MQKPHANHEQCWELIPWVVNGRASDAEQRAVLAHAEDCTDCHEELARHRELHSHMRGTDDVIAAPTASWQALLAQIDEQSSAEAGRSHRIKRPWLVAAVWVQAVAIAGLAGALFSYSAMRDPVYTTLSTPQSLDHRAAVRVVFAPTAKLNDINQLLHLVKCDIVSGPSEAGVFTLAAADDKDVHGIISTLREHSEVLFAEPSQMTSGTTGQPR